MTVLQSLSTDSLEQSAGHLAALLAKYERIGSRGRRVNLLRAKYADLRRELDARHRAAETRTARAVAALSEGA